MMPALVKSLLGKLMAGIALLMLIAGLVTWPARHVLLPLWPASVYEVLSNDGENGACCRLVSRLDARDATFDRMTVLARPVSLACLEFVDDSIRCGYLLGLRQEADSALVAELPAWFNEALVEFEAEAFEIVVLDLPADGRLDIPAGQIKRMFRPNALTVVQRMELATERFIRAISARTRARET